VIDSVTVYEETTRVEIPFTVTVGGGWGQAGNRITIDAGRAVERAVKGGVVVRSSVHVNREGLEPPVGGSTRVVVNGAEVEPCREVELAPADRYEVVVEKTGFGWVGGFTASGRVLLFVRGSGAGGGVVAVPAEEAKPVQEAVKDFVKALSGVSPIMVAVAVLILIVVILLLRR
jgi:hypothetical protein